MRVLALTIALILSSSIFAQGNKKLETSDCDSGLRGRLFEPISVDLLKEKIHGAWSRHKNFEPDEEMDASFVHELTSQIKTDLKKVDFDSENVDFESGHSENMSEIIGYHSLENGLSFLGVHSGGDWEVPVFYIIYWDGKKLRAYVPEDGNLWNTDEKAAYGNNEDTDLQNAKKRFPEALEGVEKSEDLWQHLKIDQSKILEDIRARIRRR